MRHVSLRQRATSQKARSEPVSLRGGGGGGGGSGGGGSAGAGTSGDFVLFTLRASNGVTLYVINATLDGQHGLVPICPVKTTLSGRASQRLQLQLRVPLYERFTLCHLKPIVHELTLGIVIDHGFVDTVRGVDTAILVAKDVVFRANSIFEGQIN